MPSLAPRPCQDAPPGEHVVLCRAFGEVQARCSRVMAQQQAEIERLEAEVMYLRAAVVLRDTALMLAREDTAANRTSLMPPATGGAGHLRAWQWFAPWWRAAGVAASRQKC